jgi:hypothetical protein
MKHSDIDSSAFSEINFPNLRRTFNRLMQDQNFNGSYPLPVCMMYFLVSKILNTKTGEWTQDK